MKQIKEKKPKSTTWIAMDLALGLLVVWTLFALWLMPDLISESYHGRGPGPLNRFFATRSSKKELDYYLNLWISFRNSVYLGFIVFFLLLKIIHSKILCSKTQFMLIISSAFFLALTIVWGPRQDYVAHLKIWDMINSGNDPWWLQPDSGIILNAYGPLFNLLAWPASFNPLAPKIMFSASYLIYCILLLNKAEKIDISETKLTTRFFLYLFSPFFWLEIAFYGHFDVLVGLIALIAIIYAEKKQDIRSGIMIAFGFLLKFLPILFLPILAIEKKNKIHFYLRMIISAILIITAGMGISLMIWGESTFRPLLFASSRGSSLISFWRYIKGPYSPIVFFCQPVPDLDFLATPMLLLILSLIWLFHLKYQVDLIQSCMMVMLATVIFYRVGFLQYQMVLFLMIPHWYLNHSDRIGKSRFLKTTLVIYLLWITCFDLFDNAVGGIIGFNRPYAWLENFAGLPQLFCGSLLMIALIRFAIQENAINQISSSSYDHQNAPMKNVK